jgi:hypothetical protein
MVNREGRGILKVHGLFNTVSAFIYRNEIAARCVSKYNTNLSNSACVIF